MSKYHNGMPPEAAPDRLRRVCKQAKDVEALIEIAEEGLESDS